MFSDHRGGQSGTLTFFFKSVSYRPTLSKFREGPVKKNIFSWFYGLSFLKVHHCQRCVFLLNHQDRCFCDVFIKADVYACGSLTIISFPMVANHLSDHAMFAMCRSSQDPKLIVSKDPQKSILLFEIRRRKIP